MCVRSAEIKVPGAEKGEVLRRSFTFVCVFICCDTADVPASRPLVFVCVRSDANSFFSVFLILIPQ